MAELSTRHVYLASPIDDARPELSDLRQKVRTALQEAGVNFYDPAGGWCTPQPYASSHMAVNELAVHKSLGMLGILAAGVCSIGTPMEIQQTHDLNLPVVVVTNVRSRQLAAMGVPMFRFDEYHDAVGYLIQLIKRWEYRNPTTRTLKFTAQSDGVLPVRAFADDAGLDLYVTGTHPRDIRPGEFVDLPSGIAVQLPPGTWGLIIGRSSTIRKRGLLVHPGVIDVGFRGPLFTAVQNVSAETVTVRPGERLAQLIIMPNVTEGTRLELVNELDPAERGQQGFGSSGQ